MLTLVGEVAITGPAGSWRSKTFLLFAICLALGAHFVTYSLDAWTGWASAKGTVKSVPRLSFTYKGGPFRVTSFDEL